MIVITFWLIKQTDFNDKRPNKLDKKCRRNT